MHYHTACVTEDNIIIIPVGINNTFQTTCTDQEVFHRHGGGGWEEVRGFLEF